MAQSIQGQELAFTWDQAAGLPQVLATSDGARFLYGLERLGLIEGGEWAYELHDALGSVRHWTDANAAVLGMQAYGPYGEPLTGLGPALMAWGYTGEWQDATALVYLRARWYSPPLGAFGQRDPFAGSSTRYAYASGRPLVYVDPTGYLPDADPPPPWQATAWRWWMLHTGLPWLAAVYQGANWGGRYGVDFPDVAQAYASAEAAAYGKDRTTRAEMVNSAVASRIALKA